MEVIVCKFGGSSVATSKKIEHLVTILEHDPRRRCVVLSAPGKAPEYNTKITDMLIEMTNKALNNENSAPLQQEITERYQSIYGPLGVPPEKIHMITEDLERRISSSKEDSARFRDLVVAAGEDLQTQLFAEYLTIRGFKAKYVSPKKAGLMVTPVFGDAQPIEGSDLNLTLLKKECEDNIIVFPGFFGYTEDGEVATFSRGGSDLTGAILAEALDAVEYENWTDVDGIFSAHPKMVDNPIVIPALTYKEMRELSYIGFDVLHEEAVRPVMNKKIPIRLRNTNNIDNGGTLIVSERLPSERDIIGVASGGSYCSFTLQKFLMNREKGFGRKLLSIFEEMELSYEHCPSGVDNISVILDQTQLKPETANNIVRTIEQQLRPDEIRIEFDIALISVVGEGLVHKIGVLSQAAGAFSKAGVNIKIANQGSSEISIIFGIDANDEKAAVNALYAEFFG